MGPFAIAAYRPKPGQDEELLGVVRDHYRVLQSQGLVTDRPPYVMRAQDGTVVEVFQWASAAAKVQAHQNPTVGRLWQRFAACAEFPPLFGLDETRQPFASFDPIDLPASD